MAQQRVCAPDQERAKAVIDARGFEVQVGAVVTYVKGGRYSQIKTAKVVEAKKRVKLGELDELSRNITHEDGHTTWVDSTSLIVVDSLPLVEGRLNT